MEFLESEAIQFGEKNSESFEWREVDDSRVWGFDDARIREFGSLRIWNSERMSLRALETPTAWRSSKFTLRKYSQRVNVARSQCE